MFLWFDRAGLILQFCAGFLIAPELLGPSGLERVRKAIGLGFQLSVYVPLGLLLGLVIGIEAFQQLEMHLHRFLIATLVSVVFLVLVLVVLRLVRRHALATLLAELEDDEALRRRLLGMAAVLFTLGFLLQFAATYA